MEKSFKAICIILIICVISCTAVGTLGFLQQKKLTQRVEEFISEKEDTGEEDDVTIAGEFKIVSTLPISDAYKSGDTSALDDRQKETLDMAKKVIDEIITKDMDDYEKEKAVYKYLTTQMKSENGILTVIPVTSADSDNPYGVLKNHSAVCVGYATTFRLFMQMLGIDCKVVHSSDLTHSWDLVNLDGEWYHTDCYMDADSGSFKSFNMNDDICGQSHDWNRDYFPAAQGTKYNPLISQAEKIKDIYAIPEWFYNHLQDESESFSCSFEKEITPEKENVAAYIVNTIVEGINMSDSTDGYCESIWVKNSDGKYVLCIYKSTYNSEIDISDEDREKANEALSEYFDEYIGMYEGEDPYMSTDVYYYGAKG